MIVRHLGEIEGTDCDVRGPTWRSRRLLLSADGMGFSLHDTTIDAGTETRMWYRNHLEAVYCIEGDGELEDLESGERYAIRPGMMYALSGHERHVLYARTQLRMVCAFNPPVTGTEVHDKTGAYPLVESPAPADGAQPSKMLPAVQETK